MIRLRVRYFYYFIALSFVFSVFWLLPVQYDGATGDSKRSPDCPPVAQVQFVDSKNKSEQTWLSCIADNSKSYRCLLDKASNDVYLPFNGFLKKHFDLSGRLVKGDEDHFEWFTSYARVRFPNFTEYDYRGSFGHFASYSVETRERVRCISGEYGVPMSTQWSPLPYYYPVQIAQYGLQHYSRFLTYDEHLSYSIGNTLNDWIAHSKTAESLSQQFHATYNSTSIMFPSEGIVSLPLIADERIATLSFYWMPDPDASFQISVEHSDKVIRLNYVQKVDNRCVWSEETSDEIDFYYTLGANMNSTEWRLICRDLLADTGRALASKLSKKDAILLHPGDVKLVEVLFNGKSSVRDMRQRSQAYYENFIASADWLVANQDKRGGWSVPVDRSIAEKRLILRAGWYSAMAQGHALSLLTRVYHTTKNPKYLRAASRALRPFKTHVSNGGVLNELFGHHWYEEYPTTPGTFVLNGFLYALIGLYDFSRINSVNSEHLEAGSLFKSGLDSLHTFLPLFDTGSGSLYDLRHVGLKTAPNLARWDYHSVHIYLLKWLFILTNDTAFDETAQRWAKYATGHRAKHN